MNLNSSLSNSSYKGRREALNQVKSLSENNMPILPNKQDLLLSAIDEIGKSGDKQDIEMLMGTVETMKYGIRNNSEFARELGGTQGELENNDWDGMLQATIQNAIDGSNPEDKAVLQAKYQKLFGEEKPLSEEEKTMLELRKGILSSKEMQSVIEDADKTVDAARAAQNLDYFIASSEINNEDKIKCLQLMNHFLSDEYEINPQLKDYKVQAFSEMVNDLIIKRPDEDALTIKEVSQKQTGMCAAISIARKTIAYEDKVRAMEIMMAELDNKPTMEVYDRTAIGTGKKVEIEKAHVDFTDGIKKGYRIVDTGTHQWMNAADKVGDGSITIGHYQAFDPDNYEIHRDAHMRNDLPEEFQPSQNWLRYLKKEEGAVAKAANRASDIAKIQREIGEYRSSYETEVVKSDAAIRSTLKELDSNLSDTQATTITRQILKADKTENEEFKLVKGEPKEIRNAKLKALIKSEIPNASDDVLDSTIDKIAGLRELSVDASEKLAKLKQHSTPKAIFAYNKNLFTAAAHHRRSVQAEVQIPERLAAYEKALNVPIRENLVQESAQKILKNLNSQSVVENFAEKFGTDANAESVRYAVENAVTTAEVIIPNKLDDILSEMQMGDRVTVISTFLDNASEKIKSGDKEVLQTFAENAHVKPDSSQMLKKIDIVKASLQDNPSNKQIAEAVRILGYNNQIEMTADMYKTFTEAIEDGSVSEEQLKAVFGEDADNKIANIGQQIKTLAEKQATIENQLDLPTRQDVVLGILEATGEIVSENALQTMQAKFDKVAEVQAENDNRIVDPGVKKPQVPDSVYQFTNEEKQQYSQIEAKISSWKNYAKVNAQAMSKALAPQLDELYAEAGRLDGRLYVAKEGESGLYDNQSIRVFEMITGKHYYNETDVDKVVERIKKGEGSGTSSTNVAHTEYSGHAQYVAKVSQVPVIDPETKETVMKDVLWHDNTWGKSEDKAVWTDEKGVQRTDYGKGYGGPDGYVFDKQLLTGTFVEDTKYQVGTTAEGQKFILWTAVRLQGENPDASKKINEVIDNIINLGSAEQKVTEFEEQLKNSSSVDMKKMDGIDALMSKSEQTLIDKIEKFNIQTPEDFEKVLNNQQKFLLNKTALQMSVKSEQTQKYIQGQVFDEDSLAEIKENLPEIQKQMMSSPFLKGDSAPSLVVASMKDGLVDIINSMFTDDNIPDNFTQIIKGITTVPKGKLNGSLENLKQVMIENANESIKAGMQDEKLAKEFSSKISDLLSKTIDENLRINSLEDFKKDNDMADLMIKYIDKKMNPVSDEELLSDIQRLQNMSNEEFSQFMSDATEEDLGITNVSSIDVARQVYAQKPDATEMLKTNARYQVIMENAPTDDNAVEWSYRKMKMDTAPIGNTLFEQKIKNLYEEKYGVRTAFPKAVVMTEDEINGQATEEITFIRESVEQIKNAKDKAAATAELNASIKDFVAGNIVDKYQAKTQGLLNSYVKAVKNNSKDIDKIAKEITEAISQAHITKYPTELIQSFVREVQSKTPNENKLNQLREYLIESVKVSDYASVEYSLIDNAGNGFEGMTKQALENYELTAADGHKIKLTSDEGILFLADRLANTSSNDSTALQVFFVQTGLSEKAAEVISKSIQLDVIPKYLSQIEEPLKNTISNINGLKDDFEAFVESSSVSYSSYKDAVKHYIQVMDKKYIDSPDNKVYTQYRAFIQKTQNADFAKNVNKEQIIPLLSKMHDLGINTISMNTLEGAQSLNSISIMLNKRISAMKALKLPDNSEKEIIKNEFIAEAEQDYEQLAAIIDSLNSLVE
ncbi:hypothetical protein IJG14_01990 [bacterium]|nr:hypothetical protein [bacterium]